MDQPLNPYQTPQTLEPSAGVVGPPLSPQLNRVRRGLRAVSFGIVALLLVTILGPVCLILMTSLGSRAPVAPFLIYSLIGLGFIGGIASVVVGQSQCTAVPPESGARGTATASAVLSWVAVVFSLLSLLSWRAAGSVFGAVLTVGTELLPFLAGLFSCFLFLTFLKRLNVYLGHPSLARSATSIFRWMIGLIVAYFVISGLMFFTFVAANRGAAPVSAGGLLVMSLAVGALVTFVRYANLVLRTARAIGRRQTEAGAAAPA